MPLYSESMVCEVAVSQCGKAVLYMPPLETTTTRGASALRSSGIASSVIRYVPKSRCAANVVSTCQ